MCMKLFVWSWGWAVPYQDADIPGVATRCTVNATISGVTHICDRLTGFKGLAYRISLFMIG